MNDKQVINLQTATLAVVVFGLLFLGIVIFSLIRDGRIDTVRSVKVENNTVTTQNVKISADVIIQDKDTKVRVYTPPSTHRIIAPPGMEWDGEQFVHKPSKNIDWSSKPKVLGGLGAQINGREAEELFK